MPNNFTFSPALLDLAFELLSGAPATQILYRYEGKCCSEQGHGPRTCIYVLPTSKLISSPNVVSMSMVDAALARCIFLAPDDKSGHGDPIIRYHICI